MDAETRLESIRERIAIACQGVLEDPESKWTDLRDIAKLVEDYAPEVALTPKSLMLNPKPQNQNPKLKTINPKHFTHNP
jgi:hypothetical protein